MQALSLLLSKEQIRRRIETLGKTLTRDYAGKKLLVIGILNGAFLFAGDLVRRIELPLEIDFIRVSSYGCSTISSGQWTVSKDVELSIAGKDILLVEDIADSGQTLAFLHNYLEKKGAHTIRTCVLIDKHERRQRSVAIDYLGFPVSDGFLVGYGMDCAEKYRNLPAVYTLTEMP
jgi:hypoxanthine phosphoribosyltransferase